MEVRARAIPNLRKLTSAFAHLGLLKPDRAKALWEMKLTRVYRRYSTTLHLTTSKHRHQPTIDAQNAVFSFRAIQNCSNFQPILPVDLNKFPKSTDPNSFQDIVSFLRKHLNNLRLFLARFSCQIWVGTGVRNEFYNLVCNSKLYGPVSLCHFLTYFIRFHQLSKIYDSQSSLELVLSTNRDCRINWKRTLNFYSLNRRKPSKSMRYVRSKMRASSKRFCSD